MVWRVPGVVHLGEEEVWIWVPCMRSSAGATTVELPVPEGEYHDVGQPDRAAGQEQACGVVDSATDKRVDEAEYGPDIRSAHDGDKEEAKDARRTPRVLDPMWVEDRNRYQQCNLGDTYEPGERCLQIPWERQLECHYEEHDSRDRPPDFAWVFVVPMCG